VSRQPPENNPPETPRFSGSGLDLGLRLAATVRVIKLGVGLGLRLGLWLEFGGGCSGEFLSSGYCPGNFFNWH